MSNPNPKPTIELLVQSLPPTHDAIGEYTACLAESMSEMATVRILTSHQPSITSIPSAQVLPCFDLSPKGFKFLESRLLCNSADLLLLQYNPFAWGKRGRAPGLIRAIESVRRNRPQTMIGTMFHETFAPALGLRLRLMRLWQVPQYRRLVLASHFCFFSTESWAIDEKKRTPELPIEHLPVGSNLPKSNALTEVTRQKLGIPSDALVCGIFGGMHLSRLFDWIELAFERLQSLDLNGKKICFLHVGGESDQVRDRLKTFQLITTGRVTANEAADAIAAMDFMINPFVDGLSSRRGSAMAALQHGVPLISTNAYHTDSLWQTQINESVMLAPTTCVEKWLDLVTRVAQDELLRKRLSGNAMRLYQTMFDWPVISHRILQAYESMLAKRLSCTR